MWSNQVAADVGVTMPLWPCEHEYVLTDAMPEAKGLPVVRSYDECVPHPPKLGCVGLGFSTPEGRNRGLLP